MWDRIEERLHRQAELFTQEKIYLHRDKELYVAGERIWLRPYVVSAMTRGLIGIGAKLTVSDRYLD
ncbi:MAG: hypothetical protein LUD76_00950 [Alistipes sp.]|nr:hypothetical protein [Alistipes sp.]